MLHIYYGRERIDKEKFIYGQIAENPGKTLVIVPDQYTLEGEKQAFRLLQTRGLMDVELISMSRLGSRLIAQQGGGKRTFIDRYGRHMLLAQIAADHENELQVFKGSLRKSSFLELTNNFISEMKQYNVTPRELRNMADGLEENSLLRSKLSDMALIFNAYEEKIAGKYTDSEDYIDLYMSKIPTSTLIAESKIWVYGFDSFAPKALKVLGQLMAAAEEVNVFMTYDQNCMDEELFQLSGVVMHALEQEAEAAGVAHSRHRVGPEYAAEKHSRAIAALESQLFAVLRQPQKDTEGLTLCQAANMYSEAESAASYILHLVRDKGLRYRDIVVICNDQGVRASIISRVFEEYGIHLFDDKKRSMMNSPIAIFVVALLETVVGGYRTQDIFKVLKTGFSAMTDEEIEVLEDYAIRYRIKGSMWKKPFHRGQLEYGDDGLEKIESCRQRTMTLFDGAAQVVREATTTGSFIEKYYDYLVDTAGLGEKILQLMALQEDHGLLDLAEETGQIWGKIVGLFDQIGEFSGGEAFDGKTFIDLLTTGMSQMEIGVLPPTADDMMMGTMQRTRSGSVKAVLVLGANEGVLPASGPDDGLFSIEEMDFLASAGREICKVDRVRVMEEKMAIYRNLSKPSDYLWIGYSASNEEGKESRPSEIIDDLLRIFPDLTVQQDVVSRGDMDGLIGGRVNTLRHLTQALQQGGAGERIDPGWKTVMNWYAAEDRTDLQRIKDGFAFTNAQENLPEDLVRTLYWKEGSRQMTLSPSRLERFSRCPFAHFVNYGLRPEERRIFEAAGREIGDIYHRCLMEISQKLSEEGTWDTVTEEECRSFVAETARREADTYREGVFSFSNEERYKVQRIADTCFHVCWALIEQVRAGQIKESHYEVPFGRYQTIPPITVPVGEENVYIEGKIDRLDVLAHDRVKIIDYKTGKENFKKEEARGGYRLQLMLYLKAAQGNEKKPAGVFYFLIGDPRVDLTNTAEEKKSEKISKEMRKSFRLNGIMVNDGEVIDGIAGEFSGYSDILPLRNGKDGIKATAEGFLLSDEEFAELQVDVDRQVGKLCSQLTDGRIAIQPKKTDRESPCTYCRYKGICRFSLSFSGCHYDVVK